MTRKWAAKPPDRSSSQSDLYGQFRVLLDAAAKDPAIKKALVEAAVETEREVIEPFFEWKRNGRPAGNGWNRSTNNARFGYDYYNRSGTAKSNRNHGKVRLPQQIGRPMPYCRQGENHGGRGAR